MRFHSNFDGSKFQVKRSRLKVNSKHIRMPVFTDVYWLTDIRASSGVPVCVCASRTCMWSKRKSIRGDHSHLTD